MQLNQHYNHPLRRVFIVYFWDALIFFHIVILTFLDMFIHASRGVTIISEVRGTDCSGVRLFLFSRYSPIQFSQIGILFNRVLHHLISLISLLSEPSRWNIRIFLYISIVYFTCLVQIISLFVNLGDVVNSCRYCGPQDVEFSTVAIDISLASYNLSLPVKPHHDRHCCLLPVLTPQSCLLPVLSPQSFLLPALSIAMQIQKSHPWSPPASERCTYLMLRHVPLVPRVHYALACPCMYCNTQKGVCMLCNRLCRHITMIF